MNAKKKIHDWKQLALQAARKVQYFMLRIQSQSVANVARKPEGLDYEEGPNNVKQDEPSKGKINRKRK